jgi:hypothetical protein
MDDTEAVDEIERSVVMYVLHQFGVRIEEGDALGKAEDVRALASDLDRLHREVTRHDLGAGSSKVNRVGAYATTDLQYSLALPAVKLGETRNVRFNKVLAGFDLIEVLTTANRKS